MNITKEQVEELLPQTVKDTDVLTQDAKNMFAVLLNSLLVSKGAEETGVLIKDTDSLRSYVNWRFERMMKALRELERYGLITRTPGRKRVLGECSTATRFVFNWDVIDKPIEKKTHNDFFAKFRTMKTTENTIGNCNSNSNDNINTNINNNNNTNNNENSNDNENSNLNIKSKSIEEQEFEMNKYMVEEYIEQKTKGKSYSEIERLTYGIHTWISSQFPNHSTRLKKFADNMLYMIRRNSLVTEASSTSMIDEHQAGLPF